MKHENKRQISVEDLLRLKRAERPPAEFWPQFERELRAKQLAAIVGRRPWWRSLLQRAFAGFARYHLPLGASAVLALTFISVRQYQGVPSAQELVPHVSSSSLELSASVAEPVLVPENAVAFATSQPTGGQMAAPFADDEAQEAVAAEESAPAPSPMVLSGNVSAMSALAGVGVSAERSASPSERSIADNLAAAQNDAPFHRSMLGAPRGFETRVLPARAVDPLAHMTPPSEVRRARYRGTALPVSVATSMPVGRSGERVASRLSDDRLYETISRYDVGGDRFNVKF